MLGLKVIALRHKHGNNTNDRFWMDPTNKNRSILPEIKLPIGEISISGILENPEEGLILGEQVISGNRAKVSKVERLELLLKNFQKISNHFY